jgi:hypothetical protein
MAIDVMDRLCKTSGYPSHLKAFVNLCPPSPVDRDELNAHRLLVHDTGANAKGHRRDTSGGVASRHELAKDCKGSTVSQRHRRQEPYVEAESAQLD